MTARADAPPERAAALYRPRRAIVSGRPWIVLLAEAGEGDPPPASLAAVAGPEEQRPGHPAWRGYALFRPYDGGDTVFLAHGREQPVAAAFEGHPAVAELPAWSRPESLDEAGRAAAEAVWGAVWAEVATDAAEGLVAVSGEGPRPAAAPKGAGRGREDVWL